MITAQETPKLFGIARRFIIAIVLFSIVLTLLGTCLQLYIDYRKDMNGISRQLSYIETSHAQSLANDIWLFNDLGIDAQLKGILLLPIVESLRLERADGTELTIGQIKARHLLAHQIQLSYQHRDKFVPLGTLHITASTDQVFERIKERALIILVTQFVLFFFIATFIYLLFHQLIGRHLAAMARHAAALTINNLNEPLYLERKQNPQQSRDELDLLTESLNAMQAQIKSFIQERQQIELQLRTEIEDRKRFEETLHEQATLLEDEIGQRQQTQEELNIINNSLEERINTAVSELRQKDELLVHQNRLAAMGELLNNIAHQWRQPLNNIAVSIQTMQFLHNNGELSAEEMDNDISAIMDIIKKMSQTINDFRNFFKRDRDRYEFVLREVVDRCSNLIGPSLKANDIKLEVRGDDTVRAVGYPNEYAQSLVNILHNARDILLERAVDNALIELVISKEGERAVISVRDNGGGIPPDIMVHIFDPYFTTKGPATSTGIGLYMARTLIERNMGGHLTARNTETGAEFRIEL